MCVRVCATSQLCASRFIVKGGLAIRPGLPGWVFSCLLFVLAVVPLPLCIVQHTELQARAAALWGIKHPAGAVFVCTSSLFVLTRPCRWARIFCSVDFAVNALTLKGRVCWVGLARVVVCFESIALLCPVQVQAWMCWLGNLPH